MSGPCVWLPLNNRKEVPRWGVAEIANHMDLQSGCGRTWVFAVQAGVVELVRSNLGTSFPLFHDGCCV